jgi:hypothetical protein
MDEWNYKIKKAEEGDYGDMGRTVEVRRRQQAIISIWNNKSYTNNQETKDC